MFLCITSLFPPPLSCLQDNTIVHQILQMSVYVCGFWSLVFMLSLISPPQNEDKENINKLCHLVALVSIVWFHFLKLYLRFPVLCSL